MKKLFSALLLSIISFNTVFAAVSNAPTFRIESGNYIPVLATPDLGKVGETMGDIYGGALFVTEIKLTGAFSVDVDVAEAFRVSHADGTTDTLIVDTLVDDVTFYDAGTEFMQISPDFTSQAGLPNVLGFSIENSVGHQFAEIFRADVGGGNFLNAIGISEDTGDLGSTFLIVSDTDDDILQMSSLAGFVLGDASVDTATGLQFAIQDGAGGTRWRVDGTSGAETINTNLALGVGSGIQITRANAGDDITGTGATWAINSIGRLAGSSLIGIQPIGGGFAAITATQNDTSGNPAAFDINNAGTGPDINAPNWSVATSGIVQVNNFAPKTGIKQTFTSTGTGLNEIFEISSAVANSEFTVIASGAVSIGNQSLGGSMLGVGGGIAAFGNPSSTDIASTSMVYIAGSNTSELIGTHTSGSNTPAFNLRLQDGAGANDIIPFSVSTAGAITLTGDTTIVNSLITTGGRNKNITRVTTTYTILATDEEVFGNTDSVGFTATLPAGTEGAHYRIINTGTSANSLTIAPDGTDDLLGANSTFALADGETLILTFNATDGWY